jgi:hypothetical protein
MWASAGTSATRKTIIVAAEGIAPKAVRAAGTIRVIESFELLL